VRLATRRGASPSGGAGANPPTVEELGVVSPKGRRAARVGRTGIQGMRAPGRDESRKAHRGEWRRRASRQHVESCGDRSAAGVPVSR
jgi:hypothetical protein